ncbi:MAG: hypothetical protein JNN27_17955 [Planctomycetes bacterium]|nr:hypothetical protein [Planctomycetota bacterium]
MPHRLHLLVLVPLVALAGLVAWRADNDAPPAAADGGASAVFAQPAPAAPAPPAWLDAALARSRTYALESNDLEREFRRLWQSADAAALAPETALGVLRELEQRLAAVSTVSERELPASQGVDATTWRIAQDYALQEALFQLEAFQRGDYRRSDLAGLPNALRFGVSSGFRLSEFLSASARGLLLFPVDPQVAPGLLETKNYLLVADQQRR